VQVADNVLELLPLALARPREAVGRARAVLAGRPSPHDASVAHQAIGIVLRDFGDVRAAVRELRTAVRRARAADAPDREADVLATLGVALIFSGRTTAGLATLDRAKAQGRGALAGRIGMRRGSALWILGRHREALDDLHRAIAALRRAEDPMWEARALTFRALAHLSLGYTERADLDFARAEHLFAAAGQDLEFAIARHNRGLAAFRSGDLPGALSYLDEAAHRYRSLDAPMPDLSIDRCAVLLAAGLVGDALRDADRAIRDLDLIRGQATKKAELLLTAADSALAAADPHTALARAQAARRLFGAQQRPWWHAHAGLRVVQARFAAGAASGATLRQARLVADRLDALGSVEATEAHLVAGRLALMLARTEEADRHLAAAARHRRRGPAPAPAPSAAPARSPVRLPARSSARSPALSRSAGWLAEALRAEAAADPRRLFNACRRGLDAVDEHRLTLGATELRARATSHGAELAARALRHALRTGRPRPLLDWSERWRATSIAMVPHRRADPQLQNDLAAMRDVTSRLEKAARETPIAVLQRERTRLEGAIRARMLRTRSAGDPEYGRLDVAALLAELGGTRLVHIVEIDGDLHLLLCGAGRVRHFTAGRAEDAAREIDFARFGLNRLARGRPADDSPAVLEATGHRLETTLLGPVTGHLGDGPLVIVPPGRLHAVPWALLPALRDRVVNVVPSALAWMRARLIAEPAGRDVVLVRGPGLPGGDAEVSALAAAYTDATVLGDGTATAAAVLTAIDGGWLAHIASHCTFRADSPLFSSLSMDDGPLTGYDFERLRRAPYRLVLPSCGSGLLAPAGADELLGLTSTLLPLGTAGIIASVVPVNDETAMPLMLGLHRWLRRGATLAESLRQARRDLDDDPIQRATAMSFIALGAA
jgi:tetratricopeptide (TPR) repeat protein